MVGVETGNGGGSKKEVRRREEHAAATADHGAGRLALPHKNLPFSASSISFTPLLSWSLLQDRIFAHQPWSGRGTWYSLERKRKMFHEASRDEQSVASIHRSPAAYFQRREAWK